MDAKAPHGDCVDIDEETNRQANLYAHRFSYSYEVCAQSVKQLLNFHYYGDCVDFLEVPCSIYNQTQLLGKDLDDYVLNTPKDFAKLIRDFLPQCPNKCRKEKYDAIQRSE